jgi:CHAT domain-containing protein
MDIDDLLQHLLKDPEHLERYVHLLRCWPPGEVDEYVERRKAAADAHWNSDPTVSLAYANEIIGIGYFLNNTGYLALGLMARGDALKLLGRMQEAWDTLELAGEYYQSIGDEVGWGRTRIGRLSVCINVNRVEDALADAEEARMIFEKHGEIVRALRLNINIAYFHSQVGDYQQALTGYRQALEMANSLGEEGHVYVGMLYTNIGHVYAQLGDLRQADSYHQLAHTFFTERQDRLHILISQTNLAYIAVLQGRYRDALNWLHTAGTLENDELPVEQVYARRLLIVCYLFLNRYEEARQQALDVLKQSRDMKMQIETGFILLYLATAEAELGNRKAAWEALEEAEAIFKHLDAHSWVMDTHLRRAQLAFQQGDWERAQDEIQGVIEYFQSANEQVNLALAVLLRGQTAAAQRDWETAARAALDVLKIAWKSHAPWLRYSSQLLSGEVAEAQAQTDKAVRRYRSAARTVENLQRNLTITLRPSFLGSKEEALHRLIGLHLTNDQPAAAWEALERAKSQTMLNHLLNRENLQWVQDDHHAQPLIRELERLRQDYAAFDQNLHHMSLNGEKAMRGLGEEQIRGARLKYEARIRAITEKLYLLSGAHPARRVDPPSLADIQSRLTDDQVMIEFYSYRHHLWAFVIDREYIRTYPLKTSLRELDKALKALEFDREVALTLCAGQGLTSQDAKDHLEIIHEDLEHLYHLLMTPITPVLAGKSRIILVPYGPLHYLPFHLLRDGKQYWIEQAEIVIMPTAGLMLADSPRRRPGALVLANDWGGRLPQTLYEGQMVSDIMGGDLHCNGSAVRQVLTAAPRQVLHIAAHGKYRMDQPDMSYIYLHDGQLLSDDLFQNDLSYELVTLSACETGRARAVSGDELIGLGRGFLYAGAGALIASLWRIEDQLTVRLMGQLYSGLKEGRSKADALRLAQLTLLDETPDLHPLFWGAFQLIGNAEPLSVGV